MISSLFDWIKSSNFHQIKSIHHLKSIKPFSNQRHPQGSTILICPTSFISYQDLTHQLQAQSSLHSLLSTSTPYRINVPSELSKDPIRSLQWSNQIWPLELNRPKPKTLEEMNEPMLKKVWSSKEIQWILHQFTSVLNSAYESYHHHQELGVAVSVTHRCFESIQTQPDLEAPLSQAIDQRISTGNPLSHSFLNLISKVSILDQTDSRPIHSQDPNSERPYLFTKLIVFSTHEPCLSCSMALLHSRIAHLFYLCSVAGSGGCGSLYNLNQFKNLNHRFFVWKLKMNWDLMPLFEFDP
nr:hypothetical protein DFH28DRAFT_1092350 [Melampsora americana]